MTMASLVRMRLALGRTLRPQTASNLRSYHSRASFHSIRSFSTPPAAATDEPPNDSVVSVTLPDDAATTAGQVLDFLNTQCKDKLTNDHIQALVQRCDSPKDFPKILHAITTFKRTRNYVMDTPTADAIIHTVLETSPYHGSLWVLEHFKERTGLYYSATAYALNRALDSLWTEVQSGNVPPDDTERIGKALQHVSYKLLQRQRLQGARGLGKRAKKEYLKCLQTKGGPTEHTVRRIAQISVALTNKEDTMTKLIVPFQTANVWIHHKTLAWLEEKEAEVVEEEGGEANEEGGDDAEKTVEQPEAAFVQVSEEVEEVVEESGDDFKVAAEEPEAALAQVGEEEEEEVVEEEGGDDSEKTAAEEPVAASQQVSEATKEGEANEGGGDDSKMAAEEPVAALEGVNQEEEGEAKEAEASEGGDDSEKTAEEPETASEKVSEEETKE